MSEKKEGKENSPKDQQNEPAKQRIRDHQPPPPPLFVPPFEFEGSVKRPRYASSQQQQWRPISSSSSSHLQQMGLQNPDSSPSSSNPQAQFPSPDNSSSPSLSPIPSSAQHELIAKPEHHQLQLRKGKYVSPVWKPHEMLWLARAWRVQYHGDGSSSSGLNLDGSGHAGSGRGKTRAEKDKEVAEFLNKHGVIRDAKTAGTKWDNMLGEFRKVFEWERGSEREQVGKSYFRLSPYERKIHRLPASFDEEVFDELSQFMGPRMRPSSTSSSALLLQHHHHPNYNLHHHHQGSRLNVITSSDLNVKALPSDQVEDFPSLSGRTRQIESYMTMQNPRSAIMGYEPYSFIPDVGISPSSSSGGGSRAELRRIGKMRLTWEESVSLWAEEGEFHRGRLKVQPSCLLNADELIYFDDSMVASVLEAFEDGPLKGFSIDRFMPGQQLKVFGRRKSSSSSYSALTPSTGELQDPTEYYLGCLRVPPTTLPSLFELSWYIQEPPLEELRLPLRKDLFRDLPQGKELFFTSCLNEPLDCKSFTIEVLSSIIRSIPSISASTSTTRDSYIALWDDCINRVISKFCPLEMVFIRKQPKSSTSEPLQDQWPNITGMVKNLCLWRGEEVDRVRESQPLDPSTTLIQKISWTYHDLPYVLGYYSIGYTVTFCALSPSTSPPSSQDQPLITRTDLYSLDLSNPSDRIKALIPCWRIGILLGTLAEKSTINTYSDFQRQDQGNNSENIVELTPNTTTKFYLNKRRWQAVKEIYDALDQRLPHSEQITSYNEADLTLVFKPRGIKLKPKNCTQLVLALKQVTKALVALHDLSFMHRDLSWEKVMLNTRTRDDDDEEEEHHDEWFISGFETAVVAPQINPGEVESGRHAPEMGRGVHGVKVDVWGIGYLVRTSGVRVTRGSSEEEGWKQLKELEVKCMEHNPEQRPTAADCYHHLLQIQTSLSSAAPIKGGSSGVASSKLLI